MNVSEINSFADSGAIMSELRALSNRIFELEETLRLLIPDKSTIGIAPMSPAIFAQEEFAAKITSDNGDGSYQVRRQIASAGNTFVDDSDDSTIITVYNVAERSGYSGMYSVGDIVYVRFDGFDGSDNPIYHIR